MSNLHQIQSGVSACETHHVNNLGEPLYERRFSSVLPFHPPGLAPVCLNGQAWHILPVGDDVYSERFDRTFGFYCGAAVVVSDGLWYHITADGRALYAERYVFTGNFQSNCCVVCDDESNYFHIDLKGRPLYAARWRYCGDYREGIAVVQCEDGLSSHINKTGELIHDQWFLDLDIYHKGFARAHDESGWLHVNRQGQSIYTQRYAQVENFYNGCARVEGLDGGLIIINEEGVTLRELRPSRRDSFAELSADMVGYWRTVALGTAAELKVLDLLPGSSSELAKNLKAEPSRLERLLRGLAEINVVNEDDGTWRVSEKGQYLLSSHDQTLQPAAIEYAHDLLDRWRALPSIIQGTSVKQNLFDAVAADSHRCTEHHRMLASYALHDYPGLIELMRIQPGDVIFDAAGGSGSLSRIMAERHPSAQITCGDLRTVLCKEKHAQSVEFDLFKPWPIKANKVVLARVLHDWNDDQVVEILRHAHAALLPQGEVLVLEMQMNHSLNGALCDLHLLAVTGGKERSLVEYEMLFSRAGLSPISNVSGPGLVSILRAGIAND